MYKKIKVLVLVLFVLNLTGCLEQKNSTIKVLETELSNRGENAQVYAKLAQEYYKVALLNKNIFSLKKAYEASTKALSLEPQSMQYKGLVYDIGYTILVLTADTKVADKLKVLSPELMAINSKVAPPSFIDALLVDNSNDKELYRLLKSALKENSKFSATYIALAGLYEKDKRYNLAIDTLKRGLKLGGNEVTYHYLLANTYMDKSSELESKNICASNNDKLSKNMVKEAKEVLKLKPNAYNMYYILALGYERLGKSQLAVHSMKMLYDKQKTKENYDEYLDFLLTNGYKKKFFDMNREKETTNYNLAMAYYMNQDWEKASSSFKKLFSEENVGIYRYINFALSEGKLKGREAMLKAIASIPKDIKTTVWSKKILDYLTQKISREEFLKNVNTPCKKTEAYFYIAFNYFIDNNKQEAKRYFQKVLDLKVYAYVEYRASAYYLKDGLK